MYKKIMEKDLHKRFLQQMAEEEEKELSENSERIESFLKKSSSLGLDLNKEHIKYIRTIGVVACFPNIVLHLCPHVKIDKEGLTDFENLLQHFEKRPPKEGNLYSEDIVVMVHPFFRRGFYENNNFAPRFVELFWADKQTQVEKYIAIDKNRIRIDVNGPNWFEKDTWYGPSFKNEINKIKNGIMHLRPPFGLKDRFIRFFFNNAYSLNIQWKTKNGIKIFQAEEFKTEDEEIKINGNIYYPARYIHAEYDLGDKQFRHIDGAIHLYTLSEYLKKRDSDFNYNYKDDFKIKSISKKLFKFNGKIATNNFIEYSSHYFSGNPLMYEYFEGKYPDYINDKLDLMLENSKEK